MRCRDAGNLSDKKICVAAMPETFPTRKYALPRCRKSSRQENMRCRDAGNLSDEKICVAAMPETFSTTENALPRHRQYII
jgi:hypothetical protein